MKRFRLQLAVFLTLVMVSWYAPGAWASLASTTVWEIQTGGKDDYNTVSAVVTAGGSGYTNNDVLTVSGGTSTTSATFTATVSGGVVTSVVATNTGHYTVLPTNAVATTGGTGTGCTLTITWNSGGLGGAFDPGQVTSSANHAFTDLTTNANTANTAAPIVSSASYNFTSSDVNAWLYQSTSGGAQGWVAGWAKITAVASNKATLDCAVGHMVLSNYTLNTVVGISTLGTPTGGVWAIDYSQSSSPLFSFTDLSSTGNGLTCSSAAHPFGRQMVGNSLWLATGTNFNASGARYVIASVSGTTATVLGAANIHTAAGTDSNGVGNFGGCLQSGGQAAAVINGANTVWIQSGTYSIGTGTASTPGQRINFGTNNPNGVSWSGYGTFRGDGGYATLQASGAVTTAIMSTSSNINGATIQYLIFDGNSQTSVNGFSASGSGNTTVFRLKAINCPGTGIQSSTPPSYLCYASACGTGFNGSAIFCVAQACTTTGYATGGNTASWSFCIADRCQIGFSNSTNQAIAIVNCVAYTSTSHGISLGSNSSGMIANTIVYGNGGKGISGTKPFASNILNCYSGSNATANDPTYGLTALTTNPFIDPDNATAASRNFALNIKSGGGLKVRRASIPGSFLGIATTSYLDAGPVQHKDLVINRGR